ncbi:DUF982 domain-containing protein [Agrobacterium larrymoorei]|uniref:DUF982 domain-containing protein n=1 Tax=Agrobacterium larrymoorei TaxID=160699 RepID=A0AAF0KDK4_9HYPH|nr:DUF982 domain-containing protein [Agrobacterium larrymoorei]WHA40901.1 DUF982 domain-containing protein [Agrobacterium larrymoorei]
MSDVKDQPITPVTPDWGKFETLHTVADLARCLLTDWPDGSGGEAHTTALMVCDAVLTGSEDDTAEDARNAFIEAAHESGFSVAPNDDLS